MTQSWLGGPVVKKLNKSRSNRLLIQEYQAETKLYLTFSDGLLDRHIMSTHAEYFADEVLMRVIRGIYLREELLHVSCQLSAELHSSSIVCPAYKPRCFHYTRRPDRNMARLQSVDLAEYFASLQLQHNKLAKTLQIVTLIVINKSIRDREEA